MTDWLRCVADCLAARHLGLCLLALVLGWACAPLRAQDELRYTVQPGDTLIGIARTHFTDPSRWPDLKRLNRVRNERRLMPDSTLRIPVDWLRQAPAQAQVMRADGDVTLDGRTPQVGDIALEGSTIRTGDRGSLTLRFTSGALITVQPRTRTELARMRMLQMSGAERARLRLEQGRLENIISPRRKPGARFEVQTPAAVAAVRGTHYRVADEQGVMLAEVVDGSVSVAGSAAATALEIEAGFGVRVTAQGRVEHPVALLAAPKLEGLPELQERPLVRLRVAAVEGARRYRAQVASDVSFQSILHDEIYPEAEVRFSDLPDGDYALRVRAIDENGIEGRDAIHRFRLKARPEPPFIVAPIDRGKVRAEQVEFRWTAAPQAASYVVQVARENDFTHPIIAATDLYGHIYVPEHRFSPGHYAWRVASVRAGGVRGPWSDAAAFEVLPPPAVPDPPTLDDKELTLRWNSEPGQRFLFQIASDEGFRQILSEQRLDVPTVTLSRPPAGSYYVRVQATDPDGFVGPFTATQRVDVPQPPPSPWPLLLLIPLLLLL